MIQANIPVPEGYVVLVSAFNRFLEETDIGVEIESILHEVDVDQVHTIDAASKQIRAMIENAEVPDEIAKEIERCFGDLNDAFVAVRSSATSEDSADAAWAGQLESFLNVTHGTLIESVKKCWASLFTPRAIFYRLEQGLDQKEVSVAVVVQKMVESDVSGVGFSVHPITQDPDQLIIEASYGLGEAVVSGQVTPDSYVVSKSQKKILDKNVFVQTRGLYRAEGGGSEWQDVPADRAEQQVLSDEQIMDLSQLIQSIEHHYGFPCDIEWAIEDGELFITQSRPITTLREVKHDSGQLPGIEPDDYVFFWNLNGIQYLSHDQWLRGTANLDLVLISHENKGYCYIKKDQVERCLREGLTFIQSPSRFDAYFKRFRKIMKQLQAFEAIVEQKKMTSRRFKKFDVLLVRFWEHYQWTEWFYTDRYYDQPVERHLVERMEEMKQESRAFSNHLHISENSLYDRIMEWVAKELGLTFMEVGCLSVSEILTAFKSKTVEKHPERDNGYAVLYEVGKRFECGAKQARSLLKQFRPSQANKDAVVFQGATAHEGLVRGRATVIPLLYNDLPKMQKMMDEMPEGNILVASTTSPEFTLVFKKASAIVTNEGGLGSHAAIVSREMGVPCVVGTGNAADVIRDGMEIEVDADEGVVRIMK